MSLETHFCFSPCALVDKRDLQAEMCAGCDGHWHSSTKKNITPLIKAFSLLLEPTGKQNSQTGLPEKGGTAQNLL